MNFSDQLRLGTALRRDYKRPECGRQTVSFSSGLHAQVYPLFLSRRRALGCAAHYSIGVKRLDTFVRNEGAELQSTTTVNTNRLMRSAWCSGT